MKIAISIALFAVLICTTHFASAQVADSTKREKIQFKISAHYNSSLNYYGRIDSLKSKGFFMLAEIWLTPKFYVNAAPVFVFNKYQSLDYAGSVTTFGYLNISKKWISNVYLLKPFYKESSKLVQSALKAQSGGSITFLNKILNISAGVDIKYSDKFDYGAMVGIDHVLRKEFKNSILIIDPTLSLNAGTQNFSRTYTKKSGAILPRQVAVTENIQAFNLLSIEASIPIVYTKSKIQLITTPAYVVPKNLLKPEGRPDLSEYGENIFYTTLAIKYSF